MILNVELKSFTININFSSMSKRQHVTLKTSLKFNKSSLSMQDFVICDITMYFTLCAQYSRITLFYIIIFENMNLYNVAILYTNTIHTLLQYVCSVFLTKNCFAGAHNKFINDIHFNTNDMLIYYLYWMLLFKRWMEPWHQFIAKQMFSI